MVQSCRIYAFGKAFLEETQHKEYKTLTGKLVEEPIAFVVERDDEGLEELAFYVPNEVTARKAVNIINSVNWLCGKYQPSDKPFNILKENDIYQPLIRKKVHSAFIENILNSVR
jgi:hypothetical protein